ncbi:MAG: DsbA family protein [Patescibacteria group bacterium]
MDEQIHRAFEPNKFLIPLSIIIAGALVAGAIYYGGKSPTYVSDTNTDPSKIEVPEVINKDHIRGSANAEIVIIEYSDTECPYCKVFHNTMQEVMSTYDNKVAWVYRHFPIPQLHSRAMKEAEATECVAELGGNDIFWKYLDKIFATTNSNDSLDPAQLPKLAASLDIPQDKFNTCLNSGKYSEAIKNSMAEAAKAGAQGTPYSIIITKDDKKDIINGAEPIEVVKQKIDALLK